MVAMRGWAEWKPKARWLRRRILLFIPSRRAVVRPESMKARIPSRCLRTVRPRRTKGRRRERQAQASESRRRRWAVRRLGVVKTSRKLSLSRLARYTGALVCLMAARVAASAASRRSRRLRRIQRVPLSAARSEGAYSEGSGPAVPREVAHPFRFKRPTCSEGSGPPIPRVWPGDSEGCGARDGGS